MLQSAEVGDNRQLTDAALFLKRAHLANDFLRRADESNLLLDDFVVT